MHLIRYLLLISSLLAWPVFADHLPEDAEPGTSVNDIPLPLTSSTAAELARVETGGKILSVKPERYFNHDVFRVKVLHDDGKLKTYRIERDTGRRM